MVKDVTSTYLHWLEYPYAMDFNAILTTGIWRFGLAALNKPQNVSYGILRCTSMWGDILLQEVFELNGSGRYWTRTTNGIASKTEITTSWFLHTATKVT